MIWKRVKSGGPTAVGNGSSALLAWTSFVQLGYFEICLWLSNPANDGVTYTNQKPVTVHVMSSPDQSNYDCDSDSRTLQPGQSWSVTVEKDRRYWWGIAAQTPGPGDATQVTWGVDALF